MAAAHFWQDQERASQITQEFSRIKELLANWAKIEKDLEKLETAQELLNETQDPAIEKEAQRLYRKTAKTIDRLFVETLLAGKYERGNCLLAIYAGAGGVDAQDWAEMLMRMYLRYCERKKWSTRILDKSPGGEAGIKSVMIEVDAPYAYGYLKHEAGVHRLVRLSPFDSDQARHTSFALVEILPEISSQDVVIREEEIKIETYRSSGAGGQSVNKTSSAVRIKHLPTGIVVQCQNERSQLQNKESALKILRAKLEQRSLKQKEQEILQARGAHTSPEWGNQIRSYVLHPYKLVKDHRTKLESKNADLVLAGDLDKFIFQAIQTKNFKPKQ